MADLLEAGKLLGVQMKEIARTGMLVPVDRLLGLQIQLAGDPSLTQPGSDCGLRQAEIRGNPYAHRAKALASDSFNNHPYGMAPGHSAGLAGAVLESLQTFLLEPCDQT